MDSDEGAFLNYFFIFVWVNEFKNLFKGRTREWVGLVVGTGLKINICVTRITCFASPGLLSDHNDPEW